MNVWVLALATLGISSLVLAVCGFVESSFNYPTSVLLICVGGFSLYCANRTANRQ